MSIFTVALSTTVREWRKYMWYKCTVGYYSTVKEQNLVLCTNMGEPGENYVE